MTENIKRLFEQMDRSTKQQALACLKKEFDVKSKKSVRKKWIIGGRIPEPFQERTVGLFQALLRNKP
ncbi:hypothetical protein RQM65_04840 [Pricia sp. S334]|uniref:Uncharacterized protein n=1 Tax=Pricia mediterranea TaxID=3076079 RepID=A0ABU3L2M2_9FLAO|nr:hypothetical protein [Pricia sp. S334]MDT7827989.1 hypothetical protein [Pricia sp. S334]